MATLDTTMLYIITPTGPDQFTVTGRVASDTNAMTNAGSDNTLTVGETVPVTFTNMQTNGIFGGDYTFDGVSPGLSGFIGQNVADGGFFLFTNDAVPVGSNINFVPEDLPVCFLAGTMIMTPEGEKPVETLRIGDPVFIVAGRAEPSTKRLVWVGRQSIQTIFMRDTEHPVLIKAGALADGMPARDLRITSGHALLINGVLAHAGALINGTSIRRLTPAELGDRFMVYHIETDNHAIVFANGALAETFIDNVPRRLFDNYDEYVKLFPEGRQMEELPYPRAKSERQLPQALRRIIESRVYA